MNPYKLRRLQLDPDSLCFYTPEDGGGESGGGNGNGGGGNGNGQEPAAKPWATEFGEQLDPDRAWNTITQQRESERRAKAEAAELKGKLKQYEDGGKSPFEKLQGELEAVKGELDGFKRKEAEQGLATQIQTAATAAGALYPDKIFRLIDPDKLELDGSTVKNAAALVKELKTSMPALFRTSTGVDSGGGKGTQQATAGGMNDVVRGMFGRNPT